MITRQRLALGWLLVVSALLGGLDTGGLRLTVSGLVRDQNGPVSRAIVRYQGCEWYVQTDRFGRFELPASEPRRRVTAWKAGYYIVGQQPGLSPVTLALRPLPAEDFEDYRWIEPGPDPQSPDNCANCHAEIYREWQNSSHSDTLANKRFMNLYEGRDWHGHRDPSWSLLDEYADGSAVCSSCHAPTARGDDIYDLRKAKGVDRRGVHCDFCHKVADVDERRIGLTHGRFGLKLLRPREGQVTFGPLDDVDRGQDTFSPVYRESRYCASCHEGIVFGIHVYSTYSEWLESPARREGKECQACHMTPTGRLRNLAPAHGGIDRNAWTLASHTFPGSQPAMLRGCIDLSADLIRSDRGTECNVAISVHDVGHRVPTGFVDRHLLLVVEAFATDGTPQPLQDGPVLGEEAANLQGKPGLLFAKLLQDFDGNKPVPFWLARPEVIDSRLKPDEQHTSSYVFSPDTDKVRIRLIYRRFWDRVARQKSWPENEFVIAEKWLSCRPKTAP
ncbi:MAG: hypothetical protein KatS3mg105_1197 [Gemmatales bacterium]|nr:MAG: hypothetical protein KatS3mg105_1197 [Gemmatales bacterium]